ncbi:PQQ-dependent sugar dehydrogenase, partial [Georgenia sp. 10Sc9-8]|nr:PQQ-dependent sugar dehydrogenase [Georgenia halotolerans]
RDLDVPWGLVLRDDGSALVTLRDSGDVLHVHPGEDPVVLGTVPGLAPDGEGGLLGIAAAPEDPARIFVYLTTAEDNRVLRMRLADGELGPAEAVLTGIPRSSIHNGGRIAFGPDGHLYVATGDASAAGAAQDPDSLAGKILRVDTDGLPAPGNPAPGSPVWSLGHRNVQGLGWDDDGRMFASEFGQNTWDELNRIEPGGNYGWPEVEGTAGADGFIDPVQQWRPAEASPSGIAVTADAVYVAALRGQSLWRVPLSEDGDTGEAQRLLHEEYGRLRTVVADDGALWLLTSNTFRGSPAEDDDRVIVLDPAELG